MKLFKETVINLTNGRSKIKYFCDMPVIQYDKIYNPDGTAYKKYYFPLMRKMESYAESGETYEPVFYLKINREDFFVCPCIQQWINIINELNADFCIVCDNKKLEEEVLKKVVFKNSNIKIIQSEKRALKNIVKKIATQVWKNATYAQLTTFWHAEKNNFKSFFNIDADDTIYVCEPKIAAESLKKAQKYADEKDIKAFSLDMHVTQFRNKHWTFGVTYTKTDFNWMNIFENNKDISWRGNYLKYTDQFNLDWFMTYIRNFHPEKIETYYVENLCFIHWTTITSLHNGYTLSQWNDGYLNFPIYEYFATDDILHKVKIPDEVIKMDVGLGKEDYKPWGYKNVVHSEFAKNVVDGWNNN